MRPRTSKPLVGILGDVDGRIVPVAPPPVSEYEPYRRPDKFHSGINTFLSMKMRSDSNPDSNAVESARTTNIAAITPR
jgi:hypothetical protein